jgi:prepilin-type N-terminal cleavage/methylation domain-containing protein
MIAYSKRAFSLVELSIVLVILGLLVGGVLSGQSLIRAAQLRAITAEYSRYVTATQSFKDKYFALPGDMNNATSFWGAADGSTGLTAACFGAAGTGTQTCNGDGSGTIYPTSASDESLRFWQHLARAGLIEGSYTGITPSGASTASTTLNSPVSKFGNASLWWVWYYGPITGSAVAFDGTPGNFFLLGATVASAPSNSPILKPEELWNIDTKLDDGKPATGKVVIWANGGLAACTDTGTSSNLAANYLLTSSNLTCAPFFRQAF